jgi:hypothetical protein
VNRCIVCHASEVEWLDEAELRTVLIEAGAAFALTHAPTAQELLRAVTLFWHFHPPTP